MASFLLLQQSRRRAVLRGLRGISWLAMLCLLLTPAPARALAVDTTLWVTNGTVSALAVSGSTLYVGGLFDRVGPASGAAVPFGAATGAPPPSFPKVAGTVMAIVPDGSGGWFLGGRFFAVGEIPRTNLAHVLPDGSVAAWNPGTNGAVTRLALSAGTLYAGGLFSSLGGVARSAIGAVDAVTGVTTAWDPNATGGAPTTIRSLVLAGGLVYVGGSFTSIGGASRSHIAALDASTGIATSWNPGADNDVYAIAVSGTTVYAGGAFQTLGGASRSFIGALDATIDTGNATAWDPQALGAVTALLVSGTRVYVGGGFTFIGGQMHAGLAALDATVNTSNALAWDSAIDGTLPVVLAMALSGNTLYIGGTFTAAGGNIRSNLAALDVTQETNNGLAWNPDVNGTVLALSLSGSTVYTGGTYTGIGGLPRRNLAAIDLTTGHATAWKPDPDGQVGAIAPGNGVVYVGGGFNAVGGQARSFCAALDPATGNATTWNPFADDSVTALLVNGGTIYAGGGFVSIGGQARHHLAALSAATGLATPWNPDAGAGVSALALSGSRLYAGGRFATVGGVSHPRLAAIDTTGTGTVAAWNPAPDGNVTALVVKNGVVWAAGFFNSVGGATRHGIAALDPSTGNATTWQSDAFSTVRALLENAGLLYAGGDFTTIGGVARTRLAALDETTGTPTSWSPAAEPGSVTALAVHDATIFAGGTFRSMDGHPQTYLGALADVTTPALVLRFDAVAEAGGMRLVWRLAPEVTAGDVTLERADREAGPWAPLALARQPAGDVEETIDPGVEPGRAYWYRLSVRDASGATTVFGPIEAWTAASLTQSGLTRVSPNPTAGPARIEYDVARREPVRLSVVDIAGREVAVLIDGLVDPGRGSAQWDGAAVHGAPRSGVYFVRWRSPGRSMERRFALVR